MTGMKSVNFVVIGAMKAGTTSVHEILSRHPEIIMTRTKEPNFFSENYHRGQQWYESLFDSKSLERGDASPNYSRSHQWPHTACNMKEFAADAKLIYILRDPIDRLVSHLHHDIHRDRLKPADIHTALVKENNDYLLTSSYHYQLGFYLKYFGKENILLLSFEELRDQPQAFFDRITAFLAVAPIKLPARTKFYSSDSKYLIKKYDAARKYLPGRLRKYYHLLFYILKITHPKPVLSQETKSLIKARIASDIDRLQSLAGSNFPEWSSYHNV
jgi:hypothetical protein